MRQETQTRAILDGCRESFLENPTPSTANRYAGWLIDYRADGAIDPAQMRRGFDDIVGHMPGARLSVEVSAVWQTADGLTTCEESCADRFAIYIRSPLAFHVHDVHVHRRPAYPDAPEGWQNRQRREAREEAFAYAEALAAHLGCAVASNLSRTAAAGPPLVLSISPTVADALASCAAIGFEGIGEDGTAGPAWTAAKGVCDQVEAAIQSLRSFGEER